MTDKNTVFAQTSGKGMATFDIIQRGIWGSTKRQAVLILIGFCVMGCDWLSDDGVCVSSTGCMYPQSQVQEKT